MEMEEKTAFMGWRERFYFKNDTTNQGLQMNCNKVLNWSFKIQVNWFAGLLLLLF